jgi:hypothetical protein
MNHTIHIVEAYKNKQGEVKSCVIYGPGVNPFKEHFGFIGGKYNKSLTIDTLKTDGMYFALGKLPDVKKIVADIESGVITLDTPKPVKEPFVRIDVLPFETFDGIVIAIPNRDDNHLPSGIEGGKYIHPSTSKDNLLVAQYTGESTITFVVKGVEYELRRTS